MQAKTARAMHVVRFRLRTIMIVIAVLAILLATLPGLALIRLLRRTSVRIQGSSVWVRIDSMPGELVHSESGAVHFVHDIYVQIPLVSIVILLGIVTIPVTLVVHLRSRRRKSAELRGRFSVSRHHSED